MKRWTPGKTFSIWHQLKNVQLDQIIYVQWKRQSAGRWTVWTEGSFKTRVPQ